MASLSEESQASDTTWGSMTRVVVTAGAFRGEPGQRQDHRAALWKWNTFQGGGVELFKWYRVGSEREVGEFLWVCEKEEVLDAALECGSYFHGYEMRWQR